ncbi:MAG: hypothetical protein NWE79_00740 [Candidatus Bathyarchaeota archaeon]|nr:hypothetical protein [Candidatus Bathyarchaeota archaeon]
MSERVYSVINSGRQGPFHRTMEACFDCLVRLKVHKVGVRVIELDGEGAPYKLWHADVMECPSCGRKLVARFAEYPAVQQGEPGFNERVEKARQQGALEVI